MESDNPMPVEEPVAAPPKTTDGVLPPARTEMPTPPSDQPQQHNPAPPPVTPKPAGHGNGAAIFATVVIVLGLAALAVYAYLKTR